VERNRFAQNKRVPLMIEIIEEKVMKIYKSDKPRLCVKVKCSKCGKEFWKVKRELEKLKGEKIYCSVKCTRKRVKVRCSYCNKEFEKTEDRIKRSKSGLYFCCRKHKDLAQEFNFGLKEIWSSSYKNGQGIDYREHAFKHFEPKCSRCGYDEYKEALEVHHIDENRQNNKSENLTILCRNCHALVTFGIIKFGS